MMDTGMLTWGVAALPFLGAALGLGVWANPRTVKICALSAAGATALLLIVLSGNVTPSGLGLPILLLLPVAACLSLLGQPVHRDNRTAWLMTLLLLGCGLGAFLSQDYPGRIGLLALLGLVGFLISQSRNLAAPAVWMGIGTCGLAALCVILGMTAPDPVSSVALLAASVVLLPIVPFHGGYVAALTGLPGNLPAFLAFLLPALGLRELLMLLPTLSDSSTPVLMTLALVGALYGSLKALRQTGATTLLAHASLAFWSIFWWYVAATGTAPPQAIVYVGAVGLATMGLLLAWYVIRARYGEVELSAIGGLAAPMPRFAALLSLLALAAIGLPPFGVFSGFVGMLLAPSLVPSGSLFVVLVVWLSASWYFLDLMQRLLFGRSRADLRYEDLRHEELVSLVGLVVILLTLGLTPFHLFGAETGQPPYGVVKETAAWNR